MNTFSATALPSGANASTTLAPMIAATPSSTFIPGPAAATTMPLVFPLLKRCGFTGIAPQAMPINANTISEVGPMCTIGFIVMCPSSRGVLSPSLIAAQPCASSCSVIEKITQNAQLTSWTISPSWYSL